VSLDICSLGYRKRQFDTRNGVLGRTRLKSRDVGYEESVGKNTIELCGKVVEQAILSRWEEEFERNPQPEVVELLAS